MAKTQAADYANFVAYTAYNLGASVPIGIARTALALYNLAKLYFYQESYSQYEASKQDVRADRGTEEGMATRGAQRNLRRAKGFTANVRGLGKVLAAGAREAAGEVRGALEEAAEDLTGGAVRATLDTIRDEWKAQLYRGLAEMIPVIGSAYCTYTDFDGGKKKISKVDLFGYQQLNTLMDTQQGFDLEAKGFLAR